MKARPRGFHLERRSDETSELSGMPGGEGCEVRSDEDAIAGRALELAEELLAQ